MSEPKKTLVEGLKVEEGREPLNSDWPECEEFYNLMQQYRHAAVSVPSLVLDRYNAIKAWLRQQETAQTHEMVVRNLAMLVRRLIHRIRSKYKAPDDTVAKQAWDYLIGEGLQGSVLRKEAAQHLKREQEDIEKHPSHAPCCIFCGLYQEEREPTTEDEPFRTILANQRRAAQPPQELVSLVAEWREDAAEIRKGCEDKPAPNVACQACEWHATGLEQCATQLETALTRGAVGGTK